MEEIKLQIARENGFDSWDMMIRCYCTTKPGQRVLKKETDKALNIYIVSQQRELLIAWEQYKKANWYESDAVDVEKMLMSQFLAIYCG